jgi:hypothetical protein
MMDNHDDDDDDDDSGTFGASDRAQSAKLTGRMGSLSRGPRRPDRKWVNCRQSV